MLSCIPSTITLSPTYTPTNATFPLSLHDALPICRFPRSLAADRLRADLRAGALDADHAGHRDLDLPADDLLLERGELLRSEEHTFELQSLTNLVCRLLLAKKNKL